MQQADLIVIEVGRGDLNSFREMVRQQILGDTELLADAIAGREDPECRLEVSQRLQYVKTLGRRVELPEHPERRAERRVRQRTSKRRWGRVLSVMRTL